MNQKNGILFIPTNGVGLGHLTRLLAIAKRIKKIDANRELVFFTTSPATHLIMREGFTAYHVLSNKFLPEQVSSQQWNLYFKNYLQLIIDLHKPRMLVFDGTKPYQNFITIPQISNMKKIWIKRGMYKKNREKKTGYLTK